ncbi:T9SS type A sorting domain-containing protein [uncultured Algibacter sp.]|uniref:T9SS type A sorting domain-containing protein n=1 Tax=uncultured Algibacter sp. TaxID=298659 RepID=UPI00261B2A0B|nr:T9SS type A sorting domain-containing protein [uncultured Algibacter sp.]
MKKNTFKHLLFYSFALFSLFLTAQTAPDEDTDSSIACSDEFRNATRTSSDLPNPVNVGTIDDRSCYSDYSESNVYDNTWGVYNITVGSNHFPESLQPRIERSLPRSQTTGVGSYARFTGTVRILEVGSVDGSLSRDGSYIMQAKGKHTGGGGSPDPAICLYLALPIYGSGANSNVQVSFDIFREQIVNREGQREFAFLTNIAKNVPTDIELEVGFRENPNNPSKKIHYADAVIGGQVFNWNIPEPERGIQSGVRYGAYRVKGGRAQIRWANTTYQMEEVEGEPVVSDDPDLTKAVYSLRNVATGEFLTDVGLAATPVTMSDSDEAQNTHWTFVNSGAFFNIDSETFGILRAPGSGGPGGPYVVLSTERDSPESTSDKIWTIHYNESNDTFRFESSSARYLYHEVNGNVTHIWASETDNRSVWEVILKRALSVSVEELKNSALKVYSNPTNGDFTLAFKNLDAVNVKIYSILGELVYENKTNNQKLEINNKAFTSGMYLIKATTNDNKTYTTKLVIQ